MSYEWVLLDADGTLFDYETAEAYALASTLHDVGLAADAEVTAAYQRINLELWRAFERGEITSTTIRVERFVRLLDELDEAHDAEQLADAYIGHLAESAHLLDGAADATASLADRFRLALITNGLADVQRSRLARSGLEPHFEVVVISDEVGASKPSAAYFDAAFEVMGRPDPARCLVVGDNAVADIGGGAAYGCHTCWVNPTEQPLPDDLVPTFVVGSVRELPALI